MEIEFILVEPEVPENIGSAARAMNTMGFRTLKLVNPAEYLDGKAKWVAHGSYSILEKAGIYPSLKDAVMDSDLIIGTTAKERWIKKEYIPSEELRAFLEERLNSVKKVSMVFGRERSGLTNEEIDLCDVTSSVSLAADFPSLNLAQAVMVYAYELSSVRNTNEKNEHEAQTAIEQESLRYLKKRVSLILTECGMPAGDLRHGRIMDRLSFLSDNDINLFHTASTAIVEKLKNNG